MNITIIFDTRETQLISYFNSFQNTIPCITKQLDIGDIQFVNNENELLFIIERKTIRDLAASIKDGRYREQKLRLIENCSKRGIPVCYLIENNRDYSLEDKVESIKYSALISCMANSMIRDRLFSFFSLNLSHSSHFILKTALQLAEQDQKSKENPNEIKKSIEYASIINKKKSKNINPENALIVLLSQIPGVSYNIAKAVSNNYPDLFSLCLAYSKLNESESESLLKNIYISTKNDKIRKIGPVISKRIFYFLKN